MQNKSLNISKLISGRFVVCGAIASALVVPEFHQNENIQPFYVFFKLILKYSNF